MIELKPCPFCGYQFPQLEAKSKTYYKGEQVYNTYVRCPACDARGRRAILSHFSTNKKAREYVAEAWNKRSNGWISVKDRLPEKVTEYWSDDVLVTDGKKCYVGYYHFLNRDWDGLYSDITHVKISHWMPLPEPPEGEIENG